MNLRDGKQRKKTNRQLKKDESRGGKIGGKAGFELQAVHQEAAL